MGLNEAIALLKGFAYLGTGKSNKADVVLVNNTTKTDDVTCPVGKEWTIVSGHIYNGDDVARNCNVICYDSANVELETLHADAALGATTGIQFPRNNQVGAENPMRTPIVLVGGDYVRFTYTAGGASTGGTGRRQLRVLERSTRLI